MKKKIKYLIVIIILLSIIIAASQLINTNNSGNSFSVNKNINEFNLTTHYNEEFTYDYNKGYSSVFFFGFLNCPDICPATLFKISKIIDSLKSSNENIKYYFVTVDPERDKPDMLRKYLKGFNNKIIGITGDKEEVYGFLDSMNVYHKKIFFDEKNYSFDHSAQIFLFDKRGNFFGTISTNEDAEIAIKKIKAIL